MLATRLPPKCTRSRRCPPLSFLFLVVVLFLALALSACGSGSGDRSEIESAIQTFERSTNPVKCTQTITTAFLSRATSKTGKAALSQCGEETKDPSGRPHSVLISKVEVKGSTATASIEPTGGSFDGQTVELGLLDEGGRWKIDRLLRISSFDRPRLIAAAETRLESKDEVPPAQIRCIVDVLGRIPRAELEGLVLHSSEAAAIRLSRECPKPIRASTEKRRVELTVSKLLTGRDPTACLELATPRFLTQSTQRRGKAAIQSCVAEIHQRVGQTLAIRVSQVRIDGSHATIDSEWLSGPLTGQALGLALVEEQGNWRADRVLGVVKIDRQAFAKAGLDGARELGVKVSRQTAACVKSTVSGLSRMQMEALILEPNPAKDTRLFGRCISEVGSEPPDSL